MKPQKILVACEESQAVTIELRKLGHEAYSCDIRPCSGGHSEWHIQGDVLPLLNGNCFLLTQNQIQQPLRELKVIDKWDMIIAFPPCTYLSNAGARHLFKGGQLNIERYNKGLAAKEFFMAFYNADCPRIAVENPMPSKIYKLPQHTQEIQPYQFGHKFSKKTLLWLKGLPPLNSTHQVACEQPFIFSSKYCKTKNLKYKGIARGSVERSKTFSGIAKAMARQWTLPNLVVYKQASLFEECLC